MTLHSVPTGNGAPAKDLLPPDLTFEQMVKDLFKVDLPGKEAAFLHACVGIVGEVGELAFALTYTNLLEECGDIEFYLEAAWQQLDPEAQVARRAKAWSVENGVVMHCFVSYSSKLLDLAKKSWVYGRDLATVPLVAQLNAVEDVLLGYYELLGTDRQTVRHANMVKLAGKTGRYASGKYSDAAALARADKGGEA